MAFPVAEATDGGGSGGREWGEGVLYLQGLQVHSLPTRTLQAQDLVLTLWLLFSVDG